MGDVTALDMGVITEKSSHQATPMAVSVCITPAAPAPLPLPYPVIASSAEGIVDPAMRTKINGAAVATVGSSLKASHGNEPGTLKEVVSLNTGGPVFLTMGAPTVLIELGMCGITGSLGQANKAMEAGASANASDASGGGGGGGGGGGSGSAGDASGTGGPSGGGSGSGGSAGGAGAGGGSGQQGTDNKAPTPEDKANDPRKRDGSGNATCSHCGASCATGSACGNCGAHPWDGQKPPSQATQARAAEKNANPDDGHNAEREAARRATTDQYLRNDHKVEDYDNSDPPKKITRKPTPDEIDKENAGMDMSKPVTRNDNKDRPEPFNQPTVTGSHNPPLTDDPKYDNLNTLSPAQTPKEGS